MKLNSKGQALLLVIAAMTVALALGINVSMRTLQSISRTSRTDTSERILAAAEGGIERALKLPVGVLNGGIDSSECTSLMGGTFDNGNGACVIKFQTAGDPIIAQASVVVSDFTYTDPANSTYKFKVEQDSVTEVSVAKNPPIPYNLKICWTPVSKSDLYYIIYGDSTIISKGGWKSGPLGGPYKANNFVDATSNGSGGYCTGAINITAAAKGLRIKSIGGDSKVEVIATSDPLPTQGSKIVSTGSLTTDATTKKVITVYKSLPFLPSMFDFGIMSANGSLLN